MSEPEAKTTPPAGISNLAFFTAVLTALVVGSVASLAIRPPSQVLRGATEAGAGQALRWRVPVAFATNLPAIGDNSLFVSESLRVATEGRMELEIFEPGEIVPALGVGEAVAAGKVEAGYTWVGYDEGRIPASVLFGSVPFGMEPWEYMAWWFHGGGRELGEKVFRPHNIHPLLCGIVGPETAGWFRDEIHDLRDIEGLKIRFAGLGGKVLQRLGASVTMIAGGEIFQALDRGAIDASEYSMPAADSLLGFDRVVKNNYFPGWHQPSTTSHLVINQEKWDALSPADQRMLETVCAAGVTNGLSRGEALQGAVLSAYPERGVTARKLPVPLLRELERVSDAILDEAAANDALFAEVLAAQRAFRADYFHWKSFGFLPRDF